MSYENLTVCRNRLFFLWVKAGKGTVQLSNAAYFSGGESHLGNRELLARLDAMSEAEIEKTMDRRGHPAR